MSNGAPNGSKPVGSSTRPCPLKQSSILVQVMRSDTKEFVGGAAVKVNGPTPGFGETSQGTGTKGFDKVSPGLYEAAVSLTGPQWRKFQVEKPKKFSVPAHSDVVVVLQVAPPGSLHVRVIRADNSEVLPGATVRAFGPESLPEQTVSADGWAVYEAVHSGAYSIAVMLSGQLAEEFITPLERRETVPAGTATQVIIAVERHHVCWIELELLDNDGNGIPHEPYWVRLPNAEVREGTLDGKGRARLEQIPCGVCRVRFPQVNSTECWLVPSGEPQDWLELELLDDQDQPVANEPYRVTCPDGAIREGALGKNGRARLEGITPGTCRVTFPKLDAKELKSAQEP